MRWHTPTMAAVAAVAVCSALLAAPSAAVAGTHRAAGAHRPALGGTWGKAEKFPALNEVNSLSCSSPGNCGAGGDYNDSSGNLQAFLLNESSGIWRKPEQVPGLGTLNQGKEATTLAVSCASAGNCSAGGGYRNRFGGGPAFVADETSGTWGEAQKLPPYANFVPLNSLSCAQPGDCSGGGSHGPSDAAIAKPFVVSQTNGTWGQEKNVPGMAALNTNTYGQINSVSCGAPGNCSAGGWYTDSNFNQQAFVVTQTSGGWGKAVEVPGTAALNQGFAALNSVSCGSAGNCSAGGYYTDSSNKGHAFVIDETNGRWATAVEVPGTAALNPGGNPEIDAVSCASAGNCSAGGIYADSSGHEQVFVVNEVHGRWRTAEEVPGIAALNLGGFAQINAVSCGAAGNCSAGGYYTDSSNNSQAFVVNETNGRWATAEKVPGLSGGEVLSVSCASAGRCSAGGSSTGGAFVVNET